MISSGLQFFLVIQLLLFRETPQDGKNELRWYKGNLHTHSYWSDGDEFPEMIMSWYKDHGYNFVGLSDHNTLAQGDKWKKITRSKMYEDAFAKYLEKYGKEWVTSRTDSGRITVKLKTYSEYKPHFEDHTFLVIQSEEITMKLGDKPIHMNATNIQSFIPPATGESVTQIMQKAVDAVLQQRKEIGIPMFPHLNHPNFYYGVSLQDLIDLKGERFFEVYNGHPLVHNYGDSTRPGTEAMWDLINIAYSKRNQPLLYGLGTDDSHNYHQFGAAFSNAGRGWVMVKSESLTPSALVNAMEAGNFYASTGVTLKEVLFSKNNLTVSVNPEPGVQYVIEFVGARKSKTTSEVLKRVEGNGGNFKVASEYHFVRARIMSSKLQPNPFQAGDHEMAWTQPVTFK